MDNRPKSVNEKLDEIQGGIDTLIKSTNKNDIGKNNVKINFQAEINEQVNFVRNAKMDVIWYGGEKQTFDGNRRKLKRIMIKYISLYSFYLLFLATWNVSGIIMNAFVLLTCILVVFMFRDWLKLQQRMSYENFAKLKMIQYSKDSNGIKRGKCKDIINSMVFISAIVVVINFFIYVLDPNTSLLGLIMGENAIIIYIIFLFIPRISMKFMIAFPLRYVHILHHGDDVRLYEGLKQVYKMEIYRSQCSK